MGFLFYCLSAFWLGVLHGIEPGHGKSIVGAYLVGERGRVIDAVILGIVVTITHTSSVIILGIIVLLSANKLATGRIEHILELVSGVLVLGVGIWLLFTRIKELSPPAKTSSSDHNHDQDHDHNHDHEHDHEHDHDHDHHDHDEHNHHGHSHALPPDTDPLSLKGLIALGISGGIVPCPGALAILLAAVSMREFLKGIILVLIFSLGLATVLIAIGILCVKASSFVSRYFEKDKWSRYAGLASSIIIIILGLFLVIKNLITKG